MIRQIARPFLYTLAWISILLGFIGAFLPVLPTTPFMILGAYLFSKSSPRMHSWLTSLPYFGNAIIDWENNRVIRPRAKITAVSVLWIVMLSSITLTQLHIGLKVMLGCIGVCVTAFILTRKSHAENNINPDSSNEL